MITLTSEAMPAPVATHRQEKSKPLPARIFDYLPRGNLLDDAAWRKRHTILEWVLLLHIPALFLFGVWGGQGWVVSSYVVSIPALCLILGDRAKQRRVASLFVTGGLVYCSAALVGLSEGQIEAHFHFFIIIGFIALYQDWVPFLWNIVFTVLSHGIGSTWQTSLMFNHHAGQTHPWQWSLTHGIAVLAACVGVVLFWRNTEDEQNKTIALGRQLADADIARRKFTSELLVNLARRNQSMLYQQLDIINQLEEQERDPDALSELFRLDHLATRIRRNAESLLVLSGEEPPRVWSKPVRLVDVVRAAIAETEDLNRVTFLVDERLAVLGHSVTGMTHLLAELTENAVRFSPPETNVTIRTGPDPGNPGGNVLTVEDWGVGMRPDALVAANDILANPQEVDLSSSQRLGLNVVARLAQRNGIKVSLTPTAGSGVTAIIVLPAELFSLGARHTAAVPDVQHTGLPQYPPQLTPQLAAAGMAGPRASAPPWAAPPRRPPQPQWVAPPERTPPPGWRVQPDWNAAAEWEASPRWPAAPGAVQAHPLTNATAPGPDKRGMRWTGWWDGGEPDQPPAAIPSSTPEPSGPHAGQPAALPAGAGAQPDDNSAATGPADPAADHGMPTLTRRRPQANLAPELRRSDQSAAAVPAPDAARARDALSRYQASRQAALGNSTANGTGGGRDAGHDGSGRWQ